MNILYRYPCQDSKAGVCSVTFCDRLNSEINAALSDPATRLADLGGTALRGSPADFGRFIAAAETDYFERDFAEAGGLMSYGPNIPEQYRQLGVYTGSQRPIAPRSAGE